MIRFGKGSPVPADLATLRCTNCGESFGDHEDGLMVPDASGTALPWHLECYHRLVVGGVNHQRKTCICCGGDHPPDPPSLSKREAARVASTYWKLNQAWGLK